MSFDLKLIGGSLKIGSNGDLETVRDNDKLRQDILKLLMTPIGGNKANGWYGSSISKFAIGNIFDMEFTKDAITQQIRAALDNYQIIQKSQSQNQTLTAAEQLLAIKDIYVNTNAQNQTKLEIKITVITGALTTLNVNFGIQL